MAFVARFNRRELGGYDCTYGKGSKQLTAVMEQVSGKWAITQGFAAGEVEAVKKCSDVKAGWAALAEAGYGQEQPAPEASPPPGPPSLRKGPPGLKPVVGGGVVAGSAPQPPSLLGRSLKQFDSFPTPPLAPEGAATCPHCHMPFNGWTWQEAPEKSKDHRRIVPPCRCNVPNGPEYAPDLFDFRMFRRGPSGKFDTLTDTGALDIVYHWALRNKEYCMTNGKLDQPWASVQETLWNETGYAEYRPEVWE